MGTMDEDWFEKAWEYREEVLYPELFGTESDGIFPIPVEMFTRTFRQESFDPRWLHTGVFEFEPTAQRSSWLYVSSGLSNDWWSESPDPEGESGIGNEFVLELPFQARWGILRLLHVCTFQILLAHDRFEGREVPAPYDRIPLRGPIDGEDSELTSLLVVPSPNLPESGKLGSGHFSWNHVIGITESEASLAREGGTSELLRRLADAGFSAVTDPGRASVVPVE